MVALRSKIAQMLVMGFSGAVLYDESPVAQWLSSEGLGGVLLFDKDVSSGLYGKNLQNQAQIKQLIQQLNYYVAKANQQNESLPLLIAIDYEGGMVDRLAQIEGCMVTKTAFELAQLPEEALQAELVQMASTLKSLGFNLNFAPVVDLDLPAKEGIIGALQRSFSADPDEVVRIAKQFVAVFGEHGIVCCYKHFPGHGSALADTHKGFVDVTETFQVEELNLYKQLLCDLPQSMMIMTAHIVNKQLDNQGLPATLSYKVLTELLRKAMGYNGLIISDDLQMQAIAAHYSLEEVLSRTINAGADMLIFANQLGSLTATEVIDTIEQLVFEEKIKVQTIEQAYSRVVHLKQQINSGAMGTRVLEQENL